MDGVTKLVKKIRAITFFLIFLSLLLTNCTTTNHTKTEKKILDYESSGSVFNALSLGVPGAAVLFFNNRYK